MLEKKQLKLQTKLGRRKSVIGVDIGMHSVNAAQVIQYKDKQTLVKSTFVDIEPFKAAGHSQQEAVSIALKKVLANFYTKRAEIVCVINCARTYVRKIITPCMPMEELRDAVYLEAKNSIPFSLDEAVLDFNIKGKVLDKESEKFNVIVAVSPKETVDQLIGYFSSKKLKWGLKVATLLPLSLAMENIIEHTKIKKNEILVTIEMGVSYTELNIFKNSELEFSRKLPVTGEDITQSMSETLSSDKGKIKLTLKEVEDIKQKYGIPQMDDMKMVNEKISMRQIYALIRPKLEQFAREIERSFDFYKKQMHAAGVVDHVLLFGEASQFKGIEKFLSNELGLNVKHGNPLGDVSLLFPEIIDNQQDAHKLILSMGAALNKCKGINLLPLYLKEQAKRAMKKFSLIIVFTGLMTSLVIFYTGMQIQVKLSQEKLKVMQREYQSLQPRLKIIKKNIFIHEILLGRTDWEEVLKTLSHIIPKKMYLTQLSVEKNVLIFQGVIFQENKIKQNVLSDFILDLEKNFFENVNLIKIKRKPGNSRFAEFTLEAQIKNE